jgi:DNA (cytosine-5)-methyltransferase 1
MSNLTMASLFDGSGGFPLAGLMCDIVPIWSSEIEPFPIRVTTKRMPFIKHYGDVSKIDGGKVPKVDIITFGSPCQDMSIAGKRNGLDGKRSSLFYEAIRIIKEMRCSTNGEYPKFIVWENVPGAFSSQKGQDFRAVLEEIVKVKNETLTIPMPENDKWLPSGTIVGDGYSVAWRTMDAQYFGVAQRRRRIYLVADFTGERADKILFEFEGVSGYTPQSFSAWERTTTNATESTRATGFDGYNSTITGDKASTIGVNCGMATGRNGVISFEPGALKRLGRNPNDEISNTLRASMGDNQTAVAIENHGQDCRYKVCADGTTQTLAANIGEGGNNGPLVVNEIAEPLTMKVRCGKDGGGKGALTQKNKSATLSTVNDQTVFEPTVCLQGSVINREDKNGPNGSGFKEDTSFTLNTVDKHAVVYAIDRPTFNCGKNYGRKLGITDDGINSTLVAKGPSAVAEPASFYPQMKAESQSYREGISNTLVNGTNPGYQNGIVETSYAVRRLTPSECALLQGFPWWWAKYLETENPSVVDIEFWEDVFETHRLATNPNKKPKSKKQIEKWLKNPASDSAEYKMWGNGIALPCAATVLAGIKYFS